jgi:chorismate synthase
VNVNRERDLQVHLRFTTAGESHGKALVVIVEGLPAGLPVSAAQVDAQLIRRMQGYGRGARMKLEQDRIEWLAGVRAGETLGSPVAMLVKNLDWANWEDVMAAEGTPGDLRRRRVTRPRPGHADLVGVLKYDRLDARDILERASARETAARVAAGALARRVLEEFGVEIGSHVVSLGGIRSDSGAALPSPLNEAADQSEVRVLDRAVEQRIIARIDQAKKAGDTLGGEIEVVARGVVLGLGSHTSWDRKLDGRLAGMLMSIPAVKGVEIGMGFEAARVPGSQVHDAIEADADGAPASDPKGGFRRRSNNAGGLEGGMTTGEPLVVRVAMKPISTLMSPLKTVDLSTGESANAQSERSDVTAVPAMGVIAEALVALVLADAMLEKFGGDSLPELRRNYDGYVAGLGRRWSDLKSGGPPPES